MERKIRTLKLEVEKSVEATEELRNEIKKFSETTEELRNDAKKSADMIKHDRNDNSRKRTISEPADYDEGNSDEAPRLRKRICVGNRVEWTLTEVKKVHDTCPGCSAVAAMHFIT